ncbi:MAG: hypothetical protein LBC64_01830 [Fibromonadaceae bacterium]|jgi:flagellar hook-basal body complex protein FliE|nr:hypothetical protein [Fibromonadaceae bacterium]
MKNEENQGEFFESAKSDSKDELTEWKIRSEKAKAEKLETDNALRSGKLIYADKAEESFQQMLNIIYSSLQAILSESLPHELVNCQTTGEIRDKLVATYNDIIARSKEAFEDFLRNGNTQKLEDLEKEDAESVA